MSVVKSESHLIFNEDFCFQIEPFASLVNTVRSTVPRLLLNRHAVGPFERVPLRRGDHMELGDLADSVRRFAEILGWSGEIEEMIRSQDKLVSPTSAKRLFISLTEFKSLLNRLIRQLDRH